jgi:DNA-binding NtrC family response regulator
MERAVVLCEGEVIEPRHLPLELARGEQAASAPRARTIPQLRRGLTAEEEDERRRMLDALEAHTWNQSRAARAMGMPRRTFVTKLDRYEIPRPQKVRKVDSVTPEGPSDD